MAGTIIDGNALAQEHRRRIAERAAAVKARAGFVRLDAVLVGSGDSAARVYAENQGKTCSALGIEYRLHELPAHSTYDDIAGRVLLLNSKEEVAAVMVHLPLPAGVEAFRVQRLIAPEKDVEGVNPANIGNVVYGQSSLVPCTALAVMRMIESTSVWGQGTGHRAQGTGEERAPSSTSNVQSGPGGMPVALHGHAVGGLRGKRVVVVGAGDVVGKPIAVLLMRQEATVFSCNKWTAGLPELARTADVLVAAAGVPGLVKREWVKPGAVVIDVGVNRVKGPDGKTRTLGDAAFDEVKEVAGWISPVPGGVGPMTVAMLLMNVVEACERMRG